MKTRTLDTLIVGGGFAGQSIGCALCRRNQRDLLVVDQKDFLGGCRSHSLSFSQEGELWCERIEKLKGEFFDENLPFALKTRAIKIDFEKKRVLILSPSQGLMWIHVTNLILCNGGQERGLRGIFISKGFKTGLFPASLVLELLHRKAILPGKKVVILGSSDDGVELAGRLPQQGVEVAALVEPRIFFMGTSQSITPLLKKIPIYLNSTILQIYGNGRIEGLKIQPDESATPLRFFCDTVIVAMGKAPQRELIEKSPVKLSPRGGPLIDSRGRTSLPWIWALGNSVYPYTDGDEVLEGAEKMAETLTSNSPKSSLTIPIVPGFHISKVIPQRLAEEDRRGQKIRVFPLLPEREVYLEITSGEEILLRKSLKFVTPSEGAQISLPDLSERKELGELKVSLLK